MPIILKLIQNKLDLLSSLEVFNNQAKQYKELAIGLLRKTEYWVYDPNTKNFGPSKFIAFNNMDFFNYAQAVKKNYTGARFNGTVTRQKIEKILGPYKENDALTQELEVWGKNLFGAGIFKNIMTEKWRFVSLLTPEPKNRYKRSSRETEDKQIDKRTLANILSRRGQRDFRERLLKAYDRQCAITCCKTEAALEAAHIIPHAQEQSYKTCRGILLRADIHTLFDLCLISVDPKTNLVVMADECLVSYEEFAGKKLMSPQNNEDRPDIEAIKSHYRKWKRLSNIGHE